MIHLVIFSLFLLGSCASKKEVIQGYSGKSLEQALIKIQGKTPKEALKILGNPAIKGVCTNCGQSSVYRIIYPMKDMRRTHLEITANTDEKTDCVVLDFFSKKIQKRYIFARETGFKKMENCNNPGGAISDLKNHLDEKLKK